MLQVGEKHKEDHPYFDAIIKQMENGGDEVLLNYPLNFDLSKVNLWDLPKTEAYLEQKLKSATSEEKWWVDVLQAGELPSGCVAENDCPKDDLTEWYVEHAKRSGTGHRSTETTLGKFLRKVAPGLQHRRLQEGTDRFWVWTFPSLKECRAAFDQYIRQEMTWNEPDADWEKRDEDGKVLVKPEKPKHAANTNIVSIGRRRQKVEGEFT